MLVPAHVEHFGERVVSEAGSNNKGGRAARVVTHDPLVA